jgi:hypothetical protein
MLKRKSGKSVGAASSQRSSRAKSGAAKAPQHRHRFIISSKAAASARRDQHSQAGSQKADKSGKDSKVDKAAGTKSGDGLATGKGTGIAAAGAGGSVTPVDLNETIKRMAMSRTTTSTTFCRMGCRRTTWTSCTPSCGIWT